MPDIIYEDTAIYGLLLCCAKKIETISEVMYFYRARRSGSLMQIGKKDYKNILLALNRFMEGAKEHGLDNQNSKNFFLYCRRQLGMEWRTCQKNFAKAELASVKFNIENLLSTYFPYWRNEPISGYMALGSYTSCDIYNRVTLFRDCQTENYAFATLESLMSEEILEECYSFNDSNPYRVEMVLKDFKKTWKKQLSDCKYIILDLLEERHDIIRYENGYFTKSEAFDDVCQFFGDCQVISRKSEECRKIWKESCDTFFNMMRQRGYMFLYWNYIFVKKKGIRGKELFFENIEEIREINKRLKYYYEYIKYHFPYAFLLPLKSETYFTSIDYPFGCYPWHYNEMALFLLSEQISKVLSSDVMNMGKII